MAPEAESDPRAAWAEAQAQYEADRAFQRQVLEYYLHHRRRVKTPKTVIHAERLPDAVPGVAV